MENKELGRILLAEGDSLVVSDPCYITKNRAGEVIGVRVEFCVPSNWNENPEDDDVLYW